MPGSFRVGVTSDILDTRGEPAFGREPLSALDEAQGLEWEWLPRGIREITAEHAAAYDALYVNSPRVPAAAVARADLQLKLVSRHGVGYDSVDVAADPYAEELELAYIGARRVALETVMAESDFVVVTCLLNEETRHLIGAQALSLMKPGAYLVNVARGPVVEERALYEVLAARRIAGAGLDVFEEEPTPASNPILALDNVIVAPHALAWTDELFGNIARTAIGAVLDLHGGRRPQFVVNPEATAHARVRAWLHL